jgi:two-component system, LytTR family, sensor kinase
LTIQRLTYRNYIIGLSWWLFCALLQAFAFNYTFNLELRIAFYDAVVTNTILALAGYAFFTMLQYYQPRAAYRFLWTLAEAFICVIAFRWIMYKLLPNEITYLDFMEQSLVIRGLFCWLQMALISLLSWFWFYFREQQETEKRKETTEKLAREAELATLRQQLQPHFLFNSLNSISALAGTKPEEARKMIQQLSDFLRGTLKKDQQLVSLSEELQHLQLYLDIEKVRFGHRLKTVVANDDQSLSLRLPSLLLQPIVENAIKFGLYDTTGETIIRLDARKEDNYLVITVENPFDPATSKPKQGTGFGLNSVQRRLHLLYARQDLLTTTQAENIFKTQIRIPQQS